MQLEVPDTEARIVGTGYGQEIGDETFRGGKTVIPSTEWFSFAATSWWENYRAASDVLGDLQNLPDYGQAGVDAASANHGAGPPR